MWPGDLIDEGTLCLTVTSPVIHPEKQCDSVLGTRVRGPGWAQPKPRASPSRSLGMGFPSSVVLGSLRVCLWLCPWHWGQMGRRPHLLSNRLDDLGGGVLEVSEESLSPTPQDVQEPTVRLVVLSQCQACRIGRVWCVRVPAARRCVGPGRRCWPSPHPGVRLPGP